MKSAKIMVVWEGVLWTLVKRIHNPGTLLKCDGCEAMTEWRDRFHGDNGQEAYWCPECSDMVVVKKRRTVDQVQAEAIAKKIRREIGMS